MQYADADDKNRQLQGNIDRIALVLSENNRTYPPYETAAVTVALANIQSDVEQLSVALMEKNRADLAERLLAALTVEHLQDEGGRIDLRTLLTQLVMILLF